MRAKPPVENGEFLSDVNTNGDFGSCSRCNLRRARISSPRMGWVLGTPFLARRTCRTAWAEGDEDHGAVTMVPAVTLGGIDQPIDLGAGQMFPGPIDGVRFASRRDY